MPPGPFLLCAVKRADFRVDTVTPSDIVFTYHAKGELSHKVSAAVSRSLATSSSPHIFSLDTALLCRRSERSRQPPLVRRVPGAVSSLTSFTSWEAGWQ